MAAEFERKVHQEVERIEVRDEAKGRVAAHRARSVEDLFPEPGKTLADDLANPPRERRFFVDQLHPDGGNSLLVAQYKTGKTTVLLNLAKSLADREPFLSRFDVAPLDGRIAYWNYELDPDQFRRWVRDIGIDHPERIAEPLHLRGAHCRSGNPSTRPEPSSGCGPTRSSSSSSTPRRAPGPDSSRRRKTTRPSARSPTRWTRSSVKPTFEHLVVSTHTGRQQFEENEERSRGATRLEDWMDAGWYYTKDGQGRRALRAMGRESK